MKGEMNLLTNSPGAELSVGGKVCRSEEAGRETSRDKDGVKERLPGCQDKGKGGGRGGLVDSSRLCIVLFKDEYEIHT